MVASANYHWAPNEKKWVFIGIDKYGGADRENIPYLYYKTHFKKGDIVEVLIIHERESGNLLAIRGFDRLLPIENFIPIDQWREDIINKILE
jgi:hypothetical protein